MTLGELKRLEAENARLREENAAFKAISVALQRQAQAIEAAIEEGHAKGCVCGPHQHIDPRCLAWREKVRIK